MFSRVPQKRGPSKGYIKELADRINHIEGKLGTNAVRDLLGDAVMGASLEPSDRKRPYGSISDDLEQVRYDPDGLVSQPGPSHIEMTSPQVATMGGVQRDIDEIAFLRYLSTVHPYLPFLPSTKGSLMADLTQSPPILSQAFVGVFHLAMGVTTSPSVDMNTVSRDIQDYERSRGKDTYVTYLQTLILATLAAENIGPTSDASGASSRYYIALASLFGSSPHVRAHIRPSTENTIWFKAWWSCIILDRFTAFGWGTCPSIPAQESVLLRSHKEELGEWVYHLAELSEALAALVPILRSHAECGGKLRFALQGVHHILEIWRRAVPATMTPTSQPLMHMAYWHVRLLSEIASRPPVSEDPDATLVIGRALSKMMESLTLAPALYPPFTTHFVSLAALSLLELSRVPNMRRAALEQLSQLINERNAFGPWHETIQDLVESHTRDSGTLMAAEAAQSTASEGLRHLADLATTGLSAAEGADNEKMDTESASLSTSPKASNEGTNCDLFPIIENGYFTALVSRIITPSESSH